MPAVDDIPVKQAVRNALEKAGHPLSPKEMADYGEAKYNSLKSTVRRMETDGELERVKTGVYDFASDASDATKEIDSFVQRSGRSQRELSEESPVSSDLSEAEAHENPSLAALQEMGGQEIEFLFFSRTKASADPSAGLGEFLQQEPHRLRVNRYIVKRVLGIQGAGPFGAVDVVGDCMEPDIRPGDPVFFEITRRLEGSGRYILWTGGEPQVKRLQMYTGGAVRITCDNRAAGYRDEVLVPNEDGAWKHQETGQIVDFWPVGPVVWPRKAVSRMMMQEIKQLLQSGYAQGPHSREGQRAMNV